ncbi:MAG: protein kinase, partial [Myxococcales bacterium]|nr:protein kinase [Myxococcales bacterium]
MTTPERKPRRPRAGERLGRWTVAEMIGSGAFGATYRASRDDGRAGALKVLDEPPGNELRALASLCHPCVPGVLDAGPASRPYLVMELARGEPLDRRLRGGPLDLERAIATTAALAHALAAVHHAGMTHGDVKPANALIGEGPTDVWLVDFGMVGRRGGTPGYAAPEQGVTGPTAAADVYSLGRLFGELVDAPEQGPFPGPAWCGELFDFMTSRAPEARPTAAEVADALHAHGAPLPEVTADLLRRRALTVHVSRPELGAALAAWNAEGGALGVQGDAGSGRTHALRVVQTETRAAGIPLVQLRPGPQTWDAVRDALADPG